MASPTVPNETTSDVGYDVFPMHAIRFKSDGDITVVGLITKACEIHDRYGKDAAVAFLARLEHELGMAYRVIKRR